MNSTRPRNESGAEWSDIMSLPPKQSRQNFLPGSRPRRERRLAEKIEAGEIVSVPLFIVAGSESEARAKVEQAKADKLAELRAAGDQREVVFDRDTSRHRRRAARGNCRPCVGAERACIFLTGGCGH